ncbi:hypothetical protein ANCCAN_24348 [Ancylostoma caninum]|uniref:Uncharacterized protein n=1 Tax=Ancylostoma caninum TaxID=29170 RepID=A0A368FE90_ANCCA|nr:hypothetical protein ANCCAN_24348 [Ancylostoma caninum]
MSKCWDSLCGYFKTLDGHSHEHTGGSHIKQAGSKLDSQGSPHTEHNLGNSPSRQTRDDPSNVPNVPVYNHLDNLMSKTNSDGVEGRALPKPHVPDQSKIDKIPPGGSVADSKEQPETLTLKVLV